MIELVHERAVDLLDPQGRAYDRAFVYAEAQSGGTWRGSIEFVASDGERTIWTDHETTQSTLAGVAYWATGLEAVYFEGALDRALRSGMPPRTNPPPRPTGAVVKLSIESFDPETPMRVMAARTLVPGLERRIRNAGLLVYQGTSRAPSAHRPGIYDFAAQFGSPNGAALLANSLWSDLNGLAAVVRVDGAQVPVEHTAIKDALLGVPAR